MAPSNSVPASPIQTQDIVASLPTPYFRLLVLFARPIAIFRRIAEVIFWTPERRAESWIVIGAWWGLCLGSPSAFRYLLPLLLFLPLIPLSALRIKNKEKDTPDNSPTYPSSSQSILRTLSDLNAIYAILPPSPLPAVTGVYARFRQLGIIRLLRGLVVLWGTWIVLGKLVGYQTLLALLGTILLLLPSPPLAHFVNLVIKSMVFRRVLVLLFLFIFGSPPETSYRFKLNFSLWGWFKSKWTASRRPSLTFAFRPKATGKAVSEFAIDTEDGKAGDTNVHVEPPIYFKFEIHENQRWWMGLDWTSALLPQERPSWCDSHLLPVSPPSAFTLPAPVSVVINTATVTDQYARIMRVAKWKWLDEDWSIVRSGMGASSYSQAAQPAPVQQSSDNDIHTGFSVFSNSSNQTQHLSQARSSSRPLSLLNAISTSPTSNLHASDDGTPWAGNRAQSIAEQAFTKGLEKLKPRGMGTNAAASAIGSPRASGEMTRGKTGGHDASEDDIAWDSGLASTQPGSVNTAPIPSETLPESDLATDADGWVYGDNKWENMGPKGGLGKASICTSCFTRRRRWKRRAICIETVLQLKPSDDPPIVVNRSVEGSGANTPTSTNTSESPALPANSKPAVALSLANTKSKPLKNVEKGKAVVIPEKNIPDGGANTTSTSHISRDDILKMRLKKAMGSVGA
nr:hypothetical protein L203_02949 [Cryptococcus depauperatus CBS 7841]